MPPPFVLCAGQVAPMNSSFPRHARAAENRSRAARSRARTAGMRSIERYQVDRAMQ